jgi:hypothetical protein
MAAHQFAQGAIRNAHLDCGLGVGAEGIAESRTRCLDLAATRNSLRR